MSTLYGFRVTARYLSKVADYNQPPTAFGAPMRWPHSKFTEIFGIRKLQSIGYHVALFPWFYV